MKQDTNKQFSDALALCRKVFVAKLGDYGPSWRIMRPEAITDQLFIKAKRIRTLQVKGCSAVGEGIMPEFVGIVNYGIIGIIQLRLGYSDTKDISTEKAIELYDSIAKEAMELMIKKNTDYDEAWRSMRVLSYVDLILAKIERTKEIEDHCGETKVSEGIDANYFDMINYSVFGLIKLSEDATTR
ncbi:MAG: DUF1599 domain-containing protein [Bacteroidales bacterium]|nr:DUF1599 domain-containing protein [Bacteroidales bacterium]